MTFTGRPIDASISPDRAILSLLEFLNAGENRVGCEAYWTQLKGVNGQYVVSRWWPGSTIPTHTFRLSSLGGSSNPESGDGMALGPGMASRSASVTLGSFSPTLNHYSRTIQEQDAVINRNLRKVETLERELKFVKGKYENLVRTVNEISEEAVSTEEDLEKALENVKKGHARISVLEESLRQAKSSMVYQQAWIDQASRSMQKSAEQIIEGLRKG